MRALFFLAAGAFLFFACQAEKACAEEELAPGFSACIGDAMGKRMIRHCYLEADKYWGEKLETAYSRLLARCAKAGHPDKCKDRVRKMQRSWLQYANLMSEILLVEGTDETANPNPDVDAFENSGSFQARATKAQYEWISRALEGSGQSE